jgi:hypothetical protein
MIENKLCFHEAIVLEFVKNQTTIKLQLENVRLGGQVKNVELSFIGIKTFEEDQNPPQFPLMAAESGEVLSLELNNNKAELLIEWHNFQIRDIFIRFYFIDCEKIDIKIMEPEISPEFQNVKKIDLSFHEAMVVEFTQYPTSILLCLDSVKVNEQFQHVELLFEGIKRLEVDRQPTRLPCLETLDGIVRSCELSDNYINLLIEWEDSMKNSQFLQSYYVEFIKLHIKVI